MSYDMIRLAIEFLRAKGMFECAMAVEKLMREYQAVKSR